MSNIILADPPGYIGTRGNVYLPIIATETINQVTAFYRLLTADQRQRRPSLGTCAQLEAAAEWKAQDIVTHGYWAHQAHSGEWPNATARRFGCNLPAEYGSDNNYIESLCAGSDDAQVMFDSLARSEQHRVHLFGLTDFYRAQTHCGIGFAQNPNAEFQFYWVILIAPCVK